VNRWRHRRITFSEDLTPEITDGLVYTDNAQPPHMTAVVAQYTPEGGTVDVDRLIHCSMTDEAGVIAITGLSSWLVETVRVPIEDAAMTVYVYPNPNDCVGCRG
jgi:hypothetical protein